MPRLNLNGHLRGDQVHYEFRDTVDCHTLTIIDFHTGTPPVPLPVESYKMYCL